VACEVPLVDVPKSASGHFINYNNQIIKGTIALRPLG
jgi:hypothetical protein